MQPTKPTHVIAKLTRMKFSKFYSRFVALVMIRGRTMNGGHDPRPILIDAVFLLITTLQWSSVLR